LFCTVGDAATVLLDRILESAYLTLDTSRTRRGNVDIYTQLQ